MSVADESHLLAEAMGITEVASSAPKSAAWITLPPRTTSSTPPARSSFRTRSRIDRSSAPNGSSVAATAVDAEATTNASIAATTNAPMRRTTVTTPV